MIRIFALVMIVLTLSACSIPSLDDVLSDTRTDYQKSKTLPPLDVPPDLSTTESDGSMSIPGEGTKTATLKAYENRNKHKNQAATGSTPVTQQPASNSSMSYAPALDADGGALITAQGDKTEVWNKLNQFMAGKGYQLSLDDFELGYMETQWTDPVKQGGNTYRYKFKIYSEPAAQPGVTSLYIDNEQQQQVAQDNGNMAWVDRDKSRDAELMMAGDINVYFNGRTQQAMTSPATANPGAGYSQASVSTAESAPAPAPAQGGMAQIKDIGNNKILLAIPEEYTLAWRRTGQALQRAGLVINSSDQDKGLYHITYQSAKPKETGWTAKLKKLKFWGKDKDKGAAYQVALTGVGAKTEIVILDEDGGWEDSDTAEKLLSMIQTQYNRL